MIKTLGTIVLIVVAVIIITAAILIFTVWWVSLRQPPAYALIIEKYYVCPNHKALYGGIFGKGPTKRFFPDKSRQWCWRWEWNEVSAAEFKSLATQWYGVDWSSEADWWRTR